MSQPIQAGLLSSIGKFLNGFSKTLSKGMSHLVDMGLEVQEKNFQKTQDGGFMFLARTANGKVLKVKCVPVSERDGYFNLYVKSKDGKQKDYPMIKEDQFDDKVADFIESTLGEGETDSLEDNYSDAKWEGRDRDQAADFDVNESKRIQMTLRRVTASTEDNIELIAVNANYYPAQALADVQTVVGDEEFVQTIGEQPISIEVVPTDDALEISTINTEVDTKGTAMMLLCSAYTALFNLQAIHWNVSGKQFMRIHTMMDEYLEKIREQIDRIAEIALQTEASLPNPVEAAHATQSLVPGTNFDGKEGAVYAMEAIKQFVDALELFYSNAPHEVQSEYDEWIGYWKTEALFKLRRI